MTPQRTSVLRFENVSVRFEDVLALDNVSFELLSGQTRVIYGAAGTGKSVILKAALGLVPLASGRVLLFGEDITNLDERALFTRRIQVGMLFQESALFDSLKVRDNVAYPLENQHRKQRLTPDAIERRVREALRFVELEHTLDKFPSELSGGMRRRVGIARANVTEPALVLYDSPTAGLDPITANTIMSLLVKNRDTRNTTSMVVSHRLQDGEILIKYRWDHERGKLAPGEDSPGALATTCMVMCQGRMVFEGSHEELHASRDPYVGRFVRKTA